MQRKKINWCLTAVTIFSLAVIALVGVFILSKLFHPQVRVSENPAPPRNTLSFDEQGSRNDLAIDEKDAPLALINLLGSFDFDLNKIKSKELLVPNLIFWQLPHDLRELSDISIRKKLFIKILLPLIIDRNRQIQKKREQIFSLKNIGIPNLTNNQRSWILEQLTYYKILPTYNAETTFNNKIFDELLLRANILPIPLAIAQAAIETGWGTSRFALDGNSLFGQWTWKRGGLTPSRREVGKEHSIKAFKNLRHSVENYAQNLNSSTFYKRFRKARLKFIKNDRYVNDASSRLARHLSSYSQEGENYVEKILKIISTNKLANFELLENKLREVSLGD
mgnify:CR=1 FL=1